MTFYDHTSDVNINIDINRISNSCYFIFIGLLNFVSKIKIYVYHPFYLYKNDFMWIESVNQIIYLCFTFNVDILLLWITVHGQCMRYSISFYGVKLEFTWIRIKWCRIIHLQVNKSSSMFIRLIWQKWTILAVKSKLLIRYFTFINDWTQKESYFRFFIYLVASYYTILITVICCNKALTDI